MSDAGKAVFLSYASQDAAAVAHIAEALRASGVEVWFDRDELVGGDAWDRKIRKQIKECALFVPVISAATQARGEGYFRLEWKLAVDRTHLMAPDQPFLLPVVIDDTPDAVARVADEFRAVQWTRLPGGKTPEKFCARVGGLLGGQGAVVGSEVGVELDRAHHEDGRGRAMPLRRPSRPWRVRAVAIAVVLMAVTTSYFSLRPEKKADAGALPPAAEKPVSTLANSAPRLGPKSIAVLPFENLSEDRDASAFFADGMHEDVITNLFLIRELRCVPRATVMTYRATKKTMREIAEELGVAYVLTGTVRRADKQVRITGTLLNPRTDETLWNRPYDKEVANVFAIQAELAQAIAAELKATLSPEEKKLVERQLTANAEAYDLALKARALRNLSLNATTTPKAEALLQAAVALDPKFAIGWSNLAYVHGYAYLFNFDHSDERREKARQAIDAAMALAPGDPEVALDRGYYFYFCQHDYAAADALFSELLRRQPNAPAPHHARAAIARRQGKMRDALEEFSTAATLDPGNYDSAVLTYLVQVAARRWPEAAEWRRRAQQIRGVRSEDMAADAARLALWSTGSTREFEAALANPSAPKAGVGSRNSLELDFALATGDLDAVIRLSRPFDVQGRNRDIFMDVTALMALGKQAEARALAAPAADAIRARLQREPLNVSLWSRLGMAEALSGHREEAVRAARRAMELRPEVVDTWTARISETDLAFVYAWTGDKESALAIYTRMLQLPAFGGAAGDSSTNAYLNVHWMQRHPYFFPLQGDPRFEALLKDPKNNAPLF